MEPFLLGAALGLAAGISPGPLLALVVREAVSKGAAAGMLAATAPLITDSWVVFLAWTASAALPGWLLSAVQAAGGAYLVYLGIAGLRLSTGAAPAESGKTASSLRAAVLMNLTNPHMYAFWFLVGSPLLHKLSGSGVWAFLAGFYTFIVGSKMVIAVLASRLRHTPAGPASAAISNLALLGVGVYLLATLHF
ncbi:LysE family transporter [Oceanithermus sp.]